ncbi:hypothetical protein BGZ94_007086 [Podila epigama]|nr:hypothetical protein BGZ94_007086 [Podila epigama]
MQSPAPAASTDPSASPQPATGATTTTTTPAKKGPTDPNLKLFTVLMESATFLSQGKDTTKNKDHDYLWASKPVTRSTEPWLDFQTHAETSIVLWALAFNLAEASLEWATALMTLRNMARVYQRLGIRYAAAACLLRAAEIYQAQLRRHKTKKADDNNENENDNDIASDASDTLWDLMQALLLAMDTADFVRMQLVLDLLDTFEHGTYQDIQSN